MRKVMDDISFIILDIEVASLPKMLDVATSVWGKIKASENLHQFGYQTLGQIDMNRFSAG
jgi:hypothetical protein